MLKLGVPVATPIKFKDIISSIKALCSPKIQSKKNISNLKSFLKADNIFLFGSGREALYFSLNCLKKIKKRDKVILPAFICPSVPNAIRKAGLIPILCDIKIPGYGINEKELEGIINNDVLAIIQTHLFGYPQSVEEIKSISKRYECFVIEDCAQSFGAKIKGNQVGRSGDFAIYSFGMSKVISLYGGGAFVSNIEINRNFLDSYEFKYSIFKQFIELIEIFILNGLIKFKYLGLLDIFWKKYFQRKSELKDFKMSGLTPLKLSILNSLLKNFEEITKNRKNIAYTYRENLANLKGLILPEEIEGIEPVYLRYPILVEDLRLKATILKELKKEGINVSEMYDRLSYEKTLPISKKETNLNNTEFAVDRMVVLPTHFLITKKEIEKIIKIFHKELK